MSRLGIAIVALLLAGASGLLLVIGMGTRGGAEEERGTGKGGGTVPAENGSKSNRAPKGGVPPIPATKQLRTLLASALTDAPSFVDVDDVARRLSNDELHELIVEIGLTSEQGLEGWVRSALFAEWGRRDPEAALAYLQDPPVAESGRWALEQALFGVYRGWAEVDPAAAVALLNKENGVVEIPRQPGRSTDRYWMNYAYIELYKQFAKQDAEAAWEAIPVTGQRTHAIDGIFRGLGSERQLRDFVGRWVEDWTSEEGKKAHEIYSAQLNSSLSGAIMVPRDETIAQSAAAALARLDLQAAEDWLRSAGPGDDQMRVGRRGNLIQNWAAEFPERARELIGSEDYHQETVARGIIQSDTSRAVELMENIDNHGVRARTLLTAFGGLGSNHVQDYYPTPGGRNRLTNFEERYQHLLDAVEAGNFHEGQERSLRRSLNGTFRNKVPAAREASEAGN